MTDRATPNLPSRDFAATSAFYAPLGFVEDYRDDGWMILRRGGAVLDPVGTLLRLVENDGAGPS